MQKIGTHSGLAAYDNSIPFYVALPSSTIDWEIDNYQDIPIEKNETTMNYLILMD